MVKEIVKSLLSQFGFAIKKSKAYRYNKLARFAIPRDEWEMRNGKYFLKVFDLAVDGTESVLLSGYAMAKKIVYQGNGKFFFDLDHRLQLTIQSVNFFINYTDELYVIQEVFLHGDYNVKSPDALVVIDIGFNIGATSLFLSKQENVKRIYAYELFQPTYETALRNMAINDASKIRAFNFGLGQVTRQLRVPYTPSGKARMGLYQPPALKEFQDVEEILVSIKDVADEIKRINQEEPNIKKFCKIDCEGAEYEILERLFHQNLAQLIDRYIIEWHYLSTDQIEAKFLALGFDIIKSTNEDNRTGLIYAFK